MQRRFILFGTGNMLRRQLLQALAPVLPVYTLGVLLGPALLPPEPALNVLLQRYQKEAKREFVQGCLTGLQIAPPCSNV